MVASSCASGSLAVLACPSALCPHVEFAVAAVLQTPVTLRWWAQPARPGTLTALADWTALPGTGAALVARLRTLGPVHFDVVEGASPGVDAERYAFTPDLGLFRGTVAGHGDLVVGEGALRQLLAGAAVPGALEQGLERLLGVAWDEELEPLRKGGDGAPVSWLRRTG